MRPDDFSMGLVLLIGPCGIQQGDEDVNGDVYILEGYHVIGRLRNR